MNHREVDVGEHDGSLPLASDTCSEPRSIACPALDRLAAAA